MSESPSKRITFMEELKSNNIIALTAIYGGVFVLLASVHWGAEKSFELSNQLLQNGLIGIVITAFGGALSNLLPNTAKHTLVYFRFRHALPGHRCKIICKNDPRISFERLEQRWPELFAREMDPRSQNSFWYSEIYWPFRNAPEVLQSHKSFLLYRDAASGLFVLLIALLLSRLLASHFPVPSLGGWSFLLLVAILLVLRQAAWQSGHRLVANAVAVAAIS